ncbi:toll/interleukin-1 receptor domain-containing protein [Allokutzneria sp. A3M-2-11 16]|uniref:toll/interleukin-1 receptor domain-containing protein n=1 Tax=Allokutzneria sp. A3M-2-11 16 TaxID=2962043 RepID=UPI0020B7C414|nr:toll/interleukin-1 receptor domain-containing protein [Allokutzneria sp. A3M-2-11 16]MCP3802079.1 toll/interleukin-1 receptor domain-containing protein [Allokutzneria sp. A3M-2-11 16]
MHSVFLNYRKGDSSALAGFLYEELSRHLGEGVVFYASESIRAGYDFTELMLPAVRTCPVLLAVIGPQWLDMRERHSDVRRIDHPDDWVRREIAEALRRNHCVIPVLVEGARMPHSSELPEDIAALARRQYRMVQYRDTTASVRRLADDIARNIPGFRPKRERRLSTDTLSVHQQGVVGGSGALTQIGRDQYNGGGF